MRLSILEIVDEYQASVAGNDKLAAKQRKKPEASEDEADGPKPLTEDDLGL